MKEFRIFFVVTIVVLFVLCFAYHSRLMPLLLLAVILLCGFSFLIALVARAFFVVEVQNGESQIRRKSSVFLKLRIKNRFIMPLAPLCVYVKVLENGKYDSQKKMLISTLHPFKEIALNIQNDAVFRGQYTIGLEKVQFYDLLKIFKFSVKQKIPWELTVYPREMPIDEELLADENEEEPDVTNTKPYGFNKDTFSYLREYKTGETLRHIHWKMSARFAHDDSSLIVKQMEANHDRAALIFCDFNGEYSRIEEALERSDEIIETAIMLSRGILTSGNGNSAIVFWQAKQEYAPKDGLCSSGAGYLDGKQALQVACSVAKPLTPQLSSCKQEYAPKDGLCSSGAGYLDGKQALQVACSVAKPLTPQLSSCKQELATDFAVTEVTDVNGYAELCKNLSNLPPEPNSSDYFAFYELLDEFESEIRLERGIYLLTANINNTLIIKLESMGLLWRDGVTLILVGTPELAKLSEDSKSSELLDCIEYLKTETKINVLELTE